jgi:hypothetical protein
MNDLELLFSQLGEAATTEIARTDNAQGMNEKNERRKPGRSSGRERPQAARNRNRPTCYKQK